MNYPQETAAADRCYLDPAELPEIYALRVAGDCMEPMLHHGDTVLCSSSALYERGDLVVLFLRPEHTPRGEHPLRIKRLVYGPPVIDGINWFSNSPHANCTPLIVVEATKTGERYQFPCSRLFGIHKCFGRVPSDFDLPTEVMEGGAS